MVQHGGDTDDDTGGDTGGDTGFTTVVVADIPCCPSLDHLYFVFYA